MDKPNYYVNLAETYTPPHLSLCVCARKAGMGTKSRDAEPDSMLYMGPGYGYQSSSELDPDPYVQHLSRRDYNTVCLRSPVQF